MPRSLWVFASVVVLAACRRKPDRYSPDVVQNFLSSCTTRSAPEVCRCGLDALQDRFSEEEFRGFESRLKKGDVPREMVDALSHCRD